MIADAELFASMEAYPRVNRLVRLLCAGVRRGQSLELAFARLDFLKPEHRREQVQLDLGGLVIETEDLSNLNAIRMLRGALGVGALTCGGRTFIVPTGERINTHWTFKSEPAHNEFCEWPASVAYRQLAVTSSLPNGPLIDPKGAFYETAHEVLIEHSGIAGLDQSNTRMRSIVICMWDYRGRLEITRCDERELHVAAAVELPDRCRVVGRFIGRLANGEQKHFGVNLGDPIAVPEGALLAQLALVAPDRSVIDQTAVSIVRRPRHRGLSEILAKGEGTRLEFKPWVSPNDDAMITKLARSALGMANCKGGLILVGVTDYCAPQDLAELRKRYEKVAEDIGRGGEQTLTAIEQYGQKLRDLMQRKAHRSLDIEIRVLEHDAGCVLGLVIAEGEAKPYMDIEGTPWMRAGASTRRANPEESIALWGHVES